MKEKINHPKDRTTPRKRATMQSERAVGHLREDVHRAKILEIR